MKENASLFVPFCVKYLSIPFYLSYVKIPIFF